MTKITGRRTIPAYFLVAMTIPSPSWSEGVDQDVVFNITLSLGTPNPQVYQHDFPKNVSPDKWRTNVEYTTYDIWTITDLTLLIRTTGETFLENALVYCNDVREWPQYDMWAMGDGIIYYADGGHGLSKGAFTDRGNGYEPREVTSNGITFVASRRWSVASWWGWDYYPGVIPYFQSNSSGLNSRYGMSYHEPNSSTRRAEDGPEQLTFPPNSLEGTADIPVTALLRLNTGYLSH
ncbi:hypothetical protein ACFU6V_003443 [Salmonella enterica]|nr:hypothetical protein [Salmonella enterica]ELJ6308762.1 hypothetical protein [Salmonella enterica]